MGKDFNREGNLSVDIELCSECRGTGSGSVESDSGPLKKVPRDPVAFFPRTVLRMEMRLGRTSGYNALPDTSGSSGDVDDLADNIRKGTLSDFDPTSSRPEPAGSVFDGEEDLDRKLRSLRWDLLRRAV